MPNQQQVSRLIYWIPLCLLLLIINWGGSNYMLHDFSNAYFGAYFLEQNTFDNSLYDALVFNEKVAQTGWQNIFVAYYPNTPFLAFFFRPLLVFSNPFLAKIIFNIGSSFLLLFSLFRLQKRLLFSPWILVLLPFIFFLTLQKSLYFGQVYFLIFFLLTMGYLAYQKQNNWKVGFYWGLALLLKVFPVLLAGLLVLKKRFYTLFFFLAFVGLFFAISLYQIDWTVWEYYLTEVFPRSSQGDYYNGFTPAAKSATMLFKNLFVYDQIQNPRPFVSSYTLYILVQTAYKSMIIVPLILLALRPQKSFFNIFSFWLMGMLLLSPSLSSYASILLIFPLIAISQIKQENKAKFAFFFAVFLYCNIPIGFFLKLPLLLKFPKVYILLFLFFLYYKLMQDKGLSFFKKIGFFSSVFSLLALGGLASPPPIQNNYAIEKEEQILIADYRVINQRLHYQYWAIPAPKMIATNIAVFSIDSRAVSIENNQIFYQNKQLTNDPSLKRKARLINGKYIFYLSDQNRGIGFYTLLKINL